MIRMTEHALVIAPYISTPWKNIALLRVRSSRRRDAPFILIVQLTTGQETEIPGLSEWEITQIFARHGKYLDKAFFDSIAPPANTFRIFDEPPVQQETEMTSAPLFEHNPEQSELPPMPESILCKLVSIMNMLGLADSARAEENCNCVHCQASRLIHSGLSFEEEEEVTEEDLHFRDWEVKQMGEKLYHVTHPLEEGELYQVHLGTPIGCTCGCNNCEHIRAVLES